MYYLKTEQTFDSAHFLKDYEGKCSNLHGHCWRVVAWVASGRLEEDNLQTKGMIMDFSDLKGALKSLCDQFDHCLIYEEGSLRSSTEEALKEEAFRLMSVPFRPTAENFAAYFCQRLQTSGLPVCRVEVYETEKNCAVYEPEKE